MDWITYSENSITMLIPKALKKSRSTPLLKGRLDPSDPKSELILTVEPDLNASLVQAHKNSVQPPPIKEWMGTTWKFYHRGESITRPGGIEIKVTQIAPKPHGEGHSWTVMFPLGARWLLVDILNPLGGLTWEQFESIGTKIIESIRINES